MKKFPKIRYPNDSETDGLLAGDVVVTEKFDGANCLPYGQRIKTSDGTIPIGRIVNNQLDVEVESYDAETGDIEYKPITNYFKNGSADAWVKIEFDGGSRSSCLTVTPKHEIYTNDGLVEARNLSNGDKLITRHGKIVDDTKELITGSLLGDASAIDVDSGKSVHLEETHGERQHDYTRWKASMLSPFVSNVRKEKSAFDESHRETAKLSYCTKSIPHLQCVISPLYEDGKKTISEDVELSWKSIAVWYCDDGSPTHIHSDKQRTRVKFHTQGFSKSGTSILFEKLNDMGLDGRVTDYGIGPVIELGADSSEILFDNIAPYVPQCMERKIPDKFTVTESEWDIETPPRDTVTVTSVDNTERHNDMRYDIEVEDNHNYVTKDVVVSNCRFTWNDDEQLIVGTRNHHFPADDENVPKTFRHAIEYIETVVDTDNHPAPQNYVLFGEAMHLHSLKYDDVDWHTPSKGSAHVPLDSAYPNVVIFDGYDKIGDEWLSWNNVTALAGDLNLETSPVLERGNPDDLSFEVPDESHFGGPPEGIVIRREDGSVRAKKVTDTFQETDTQSSSQPTEAQSNAAEFTAMFVTDSRIEKQAHKLIDEGNYDEIEMQMMEQLPVNVLQDVMVEEGWNLLNDEYTFECQFDSDFKSSVRSKTSKKCARVLKTLLQDI